MDLTVRSTWIQAAKIRGLCLGLVVLLVCTCAEQQPQETDPLANVSPEMQALLQTVLMPPMRARIPWQKTYIAGHAEPFSNAPGTRVRVRYGSESGRAESPLKGYEITDTASGEILLTREFSTDAPPLRQHTCTCYTENGCEYPDALELPTQELLPGLYDVRLQDTAQKFSPPISFLIRPDFDAPRAPILVLVPTYTYWAYSQFGGGSLYFPRQTTHDRSASIQRPFDDERGAQHTTESLAPILKQLAEMGAQYGVIASEDLHHTPEWLEGTRVLLIGPHDEYWSFEMALATHEFQLQGGHLAIFGGNFRWWPVEPVNQQLRELRMYKDPSTNEHPIAAKLFSHVLPAEASFGLAWRFLYYSVRSLHHTQEEAIAAGVSPELYYRSQGVEIIDAEHPVFAGTGLRNGDLYGAEFYLVADEIDGIPLLPNGEVDYAQAPDAARNIRVLCRTWGTDMSTIRQGGVVAETLLPSGSTILYFGSMTWYKSLTEDTSGRGEIIFRNAIEHMLARP